MMNVIPLNHKRIRAKVVKDYLGDRRAFCFSCGNATRWLKRAGVNLIPIDGERLHATAWIEPKEAEHYFQGFNATSGYLPLFLTQAIADRIAQELNGALIHLMPTAKVWVPLGSSELAFCVSHIVPAHCLELFASNDYPPTRQGMRYPLEGFITANIPRHFCKGAMLAELHKEVYAISKPGDVLIDTSEAEQ